MNTIGVDRIMARIKRDLGYDVELTTVIEWAGDVLDAIGVPYMYDEAVSFLEVKDHKAMAPDYMHAVIQIARDREYEGDVGKCVDQTVEGVSKETDDKLSCLPCYEPEDEFEYHQPYFTLKLNYELWVGSGTYMRRWSPVRLSTHKFFNTVVCKENKYDELYRDVMDEYSISDGVFRFSFREGLVAVAHVRHRVDDNGLPLFPDHASYVKAIVAYVRYMLAMREFDQNGANINKVMKYEQDYHWYVQQAANKALSRKSIDEMENRAASRDYLLPRQYRYGDFFAGMNRHENRTWNSRRTWRRI